MRKEMLNMKNMRPINREIAGQVATLASRFDCTFVMEFANSIVNMKSMLGLLSQMLPMNESCSEPRAKAKTKPWTPC